MSTTRRLSAPGFEKSTDGLRTRDISSKRGGVFNRGSKRLGVVPLPLTTVRHSLTVVSDHRKRCWFSLPDVNECINTDRTARHVLRLKLGVAATVILVSG
jgi:hypothetical protein